MKRIKRPGSEATALNVGENNGPPKAYRIPVAAGSVSNGPANVQM